MSLGMFKAYWQAILGYRRRAIILVLLIAVAGLFEGSALLTLGPIFQAGSSQNFQESRFFEFYRSLGLEEDNYLVFSIGAFVVLGFISAAITLAVGIFTVRFETQHEKSLRERLTRALIQMKWTEFVSLGLGDISKAILMESHYISYGTRNCLMGMGYLIVCFCFSIAALFISTKMAFLTLIFVSILGLGYRYVGNKSYRYSKEMSEWGTVIGNQISELFGNLKFFRAIGASRDILDKSQSLYHRYQRTFFLGHIFQPIMRFTFEAGGVCLVGFLLGYSFFIAKESVSQLVVFLVIFYRLVPRVMTANQWFHIARTYQPWFQDWSERLEFISTKAEDNRGRKEPQFKNSLEIRKLFYQYNKEGGDVLREISFTIKKGDCIALVGESGGGKSTLIDLVTGLLEPGQGKILLDGVPLQELEIDQWRSKIGLVLQDTPVLHTTVLENITLGQTFIDEQKVRRCAELAHAWEFIQELPKGLNTIVGEKGSRLSGGQKQRLVLARALYRDPWILILDEATSALDGQSELKIHDALKALKGKLTILMVAHRLKTVNLADNILVLRQGRILERGGWNELMQKQEGQFRKMAELQGISSLPEEIEIKK